MSERPTPDPTTPSPDTGLGDDDLDAEEVVELPDREAMSIIQPIAPSIGVPIDPTWVDEQDPPPGFDV
jgi:hypothetical protein